MRGSVTLNGNSLITGNEASFGGGIGGNGFAGGSVILNDNSTISGNTASTNGGGIYFSAGPVTMNDNSTISGNTAAVHGGGIRIHGGALTMNEDSTISGNTATLDGGGVYLCGETGNLCNNGVYGGTLTMNVSSSIAANSAGRNGGGVYNLRCVLNSVVAGTPGNVLRSVLCALLTEPIPRIPPTRRRRRHICGPTLRFGSSKRLSFTSAAAGRPRSPGHRPVRWLPRLATTRATS